METLSLGGGVTAAPALPGSVPSPPPSASGLECHLGDLQPPTALAPKSIPDVDQVPCAQAAAWAELMGCECQGCCLGPDGAGGQGKGPPPQPLQAQGLLEGSGRKEGPRGTGERLVKRGQMGGGRSFRVGLVSVGVSSGVATRLGRMWTLGPQTRTGVSR